jgi:hypothetical protein
MRSPSNYFVVAVAFFSRPSPNKSLETLRVYRAALPVFQFAQSPSRPLPSYHRVRLLSPSIATRFILQTELSIPPSIFTCDAADHSSAHRTLIITRRNQNDLKNASLKFIKVFFCKFGKLKMCISSRHFISRNCAWNPHLSGSHIGSEPLNTKSCCSHYAVVKLLNSHLCLCSHTRFARPHDSIVDS